MTDKIVRLPDIGYDARYCAACGVRTAVLHSDVDPARGWRKRWRKCPKCGKATTTVELIVLPGSTGKLRPAYALLELEEEG